MLQVGTVYAPNTLPDSDLVKWAGLFQWRQALISALQQ
jgi:hypothetical protein